jgi:hypothetical protein
MAQVEDVEYTVVKEFPEEGVTVEAPQGVEITINDKQFGQFDQMVPFEDLQGNPFRPFRAVINLVIQGGQKDNSHRLFDPPLKLRVQYTEADEKLGEYAGRSPRLGYWDHTLANGQGRWVPFDASHGFRRRAHAGGRGGEGIALISKWPEDPPVAWAD